MPRSLCVRNRCDITIAHIGLALYTVGMKAMTVGVGAFDALRAEVLGSAQSRQQHRIHAVLLVAGGLSCRAVARLLGDSPRAVEYWVNRYKSNNINGLADELAQGRVPRLSAEQFAQLRVAVMSVPAGSVARVWTGEDIVAFVARRWATVLGLRQAQRVLAKIRS